MKEKWELLSDTLEFSWDLILEFFDCIIIVKSKNYQELHFRNGFIRCQDVKSPDYDRILAHSYYELCIKKYKNEKEVVRFKEDDINIMEQENEKNNEEKNKKLNLKKENVEIK
jgi:hypothetical protein